MSILKLLSSISRLIHNWGFKKECFIAIGLQMTILNFHSVHIYYKYMVTPCFVIPIKNIGHCGDTHSITYVLLVLWLEMNKVMQYLKKKNVCSIIFGVFPSCLKKKNLIFITCIKPK